MSKLPRCLRLLHLDIEPKYAAMIYSGEKSMEFRKNRLPLKAPIVLVEDGVETGYMWFCWEFRSTPEAVWDFANRRSMVFAGKGRCGITKSWLLEYAGKGHVSAYGIVLAKRMDQCPVWDFPEPETDKA